MKFLGIWPEERRINKFSSYVVLITISIMVLIFSIPQTIKLCIIWGDFDMMVEILSIGNITVLIAVIKTTAFWSNGTSNFILDYEKTFLFFVNREEAHGYILVFLSINCITKALKNLLLLMEENLREARSRQEVRRMMETAKLVRTLSTGGIICILLIPLTAFCVRVWMNRYTGRMLLATVYTPYELLTTPNYEITIVSQLVAGLYTTGAYTMVDIFMATCVFHTCGQLANLKARFQSLHSKGRYGSQVELADIINKHDALYKFVETIENLFNYMLLIQMLGCTILLCIQLFQAIETITGQNLEVLVVQILFFGTYIGYILLQLYLYCYIGEKLHLESISMIEAAYECKWYDLSPSEAKSIILIMVRASTPLRLTAGKFCFLNHELFKNILKTSMSYLSVLYAIQTND